VPPDESEFFNKYFPGFSSDFQVLTRGDGRNGYVPLRWQWRLFKQFCQNDIRKVCDLPTGLGKTSVIHIWLLALRHQILEKILRLPTRLVYVVDRRTVVDQATYIAEGAKKNLTGLGLADDWLSVSTLRGQFADNREWTINPSRPAIIIGTVDMIGSRLLFSGYRSSYKQRPLDAGLLGQDSFLVLDEAHLSEPFAKLIRALSDEGTFQREQGKPMRVMCMSATTAGDDPHRFKLEETDREGSPDTNPIIQRYEARKRLSISLPLDKKTAETNIVEAATRLAQGGSRVVIFVRRPDDAQRIERDIGKLKPFLNAVTVLTGTMRGLERDELLERPVMKRFLDGDERPEDRPGKAPAILVSTSAGEVGFDLNADHMVSDAAPLDSMIQRLGRVNRRGYGDATVEVFVAKSEEKDQKGQDWPKEKTKPTYESAAAEAIKCLGNLRNSGDGTFNASPKALDALKKKLTEQQLLAASAPKPTTVELTDILLDAWSMTTITQQMPGRPPVAPWLRGLDAEGPQTTIAWRAELDIEGFDQLDADDMEEWFDTHRVLPHETLSVPTSKAEKWITGRWKALPDEVRDAVGERSCVIDRAGLQMLKLRDLVDELMRGPGSIADADIILPAAFGGIERGKGLLGEGAPELVHPESETTRVEALKSPDVADIFGRCRLLRISGDDAESETALVGAGPTDRAGRVRFVIDLPSNGDVCRQLVSLVPKLERPDFGTAKQPLSCHVSLVEKHARNIAQELLGFLDDTRQALGLAATWHDRGKDRDIWQRAAGRKDGEVPLGKSGGSMRPVAGGYRHEFGSLREFMDAHEGKVPRDVFDLAMHLIAAHHGRGRPHFPKGGYDPLARSDSPQVAIEVVRRFARLQRKYGSWRLAWLENLLRCADAMASAESVEGEK